jgi:hypothetical protein
LAYPRLLGIGTTVTIALQGWWKIAPGGNDCEYCLWWSFDLEAKLRGLSVEGWLELVHREKAEHTTAGFA